MTDDADGTAPMNWGSWPPQPQRINAVVGAAPALANRIAGGDWTNGAMLLARRVANYVE